MPRLSSRRLKRLVQHTDPSLSNGGYRQLSARLAAGADTAPAGFELGLEQHSDLSITAGSTTRVASALSRGADLRLYMATNDDSVGRPGGSRGMSKSSAYEETLYFLQTAAPWSMEAIADDGVTALFAGMCPHHTSLVHEGAKPKQPYFSLFRYDISGTYSHIKWMSDRIVDATQTYNYKIYRWFICDRYTVCYEHDSDGKPLAGSIDTLRDAVRKGLSIKVGLLAIAALSPNHMIQGSPKLEADDSVTFLPSLQPVIKSDGSVCMNTDGYAVHDWTS